MWTLDARAARLVAAISRRIGTVRQAAGPSAWLLLVWLAATAAFGQAPEIHYFQRGSMPPGAIGRAQLQRGGPLAHYMQPVEIRAPQGVQLALAMDGIFEPPQPAPARVGMLVGRVYRLKVVSIPNYEGQEVYPSVEIINRLYPPAGQELRFPIPIELTQRELQLALDGQFVTRVIYLEDPRSALAEREVPGDEQRYWEVGPGQDPLRVADRLGRPMAILRLGSRVPDMDQATGRFLFDSPPWMRLPELPPETDPTAETELTAQRPPNVAPPAAGARRPSVPYPARIQKR
jgi:hypothetical protein